MTNLSVNNSETIDYDVSFNSAYFPPTYDKIYENSTSVNELPSFSTAINHVSAPSGTTQNLQKEVNTNGTKTNEVDLTIMSDADNNISVITMGNNENERSTIRI